MQPGPGASVEERASGRSLSRFYEATRSISIAPQDVVLVYLKTNKPYNKNTKTKQGIVLIFAFSF